MRKLKTLAISTLTTVLLTLMLAACGGDPPTEQAQTQEQKSENSQGSIPTAPPTNTVEPLPTKPTRLTNIATPTRDTGNMGRATTTDSTKAPTPQVEAGSTPEAQEPTSQDAPTPAISAESLIPTDPKTNDTILLQDIYDRMDLAQFALDPNEPIERFGAQKNSWQEIQVFRTKRVLNHPYAYLFPHLKEAARRAAESTRTAEEFQYSPYEVPPQQEGTAKYQDTDRIIHFIYHPWFETFDTTVVIEREPDLFPDFYKHSSVYEYNGPLWFGKKSTRGVLSEAIAKAMADAAHPTTRPMPLKWKPKVDLTGRVDEKELWVEEFNWKLEGYLRTTVNRYSIAKKREHKQFNAEVIGNYASPRIRWEFLHDRLPIIKITAENSKILPLTIQGLKTPTPTEYSVSFVISFQNRWASLQDSNRWTKRFVNQGGLQMNSELQIPEGETTPSEEEWHLTDYMQHKIIGPVVVQIHKSDILKPGIYPVTPTTAHWEAPGHIATDKQMLRRQAIYIRNERTGEYSYHYEHFPQSRMPNVGWPLPDHVMTDPMNGPDTIFWEIHEMDQREW